MFHGDAGLWDVVGFVAQRGMCDILVTIVSLRDLGRIFWHANAPYRTVQTMNVHALEAWIMVQHSMFISGKTVLKSSLLAGLQRTFGVTTLIRFSSHKAIKMPRLFLEPVRALAQVSKRHDFSQCYRTCVSSW